MQEKLHYTRVMTMHPRTERPGGRTARTRATVHDAVHELLSEPASELSIPAVAARSGVHATTLYRRWGTIESLVLDVAVDDVNAQAPVPATGDLESDLTIYVRRLLAGIQAQGHSRFFQVLLSAAQQATTDDEVPALIAPRLAQFQALLDAAGVTRIDAMRLVEIVIAPAYFWGQLGTPLDPDRDTQRLVETALLASRGREDRKEPLSPKNAADDTSSLRGTAQAQRNDKDRSSKT
jgi:AcrR family transcriptional regulator